MITKRYRSDYKGEFVVVTTSQQDGSRKQGRVWIPNSVENQHISNRAAVIGSSMDKKKFNYPILQRHRGGLMGKLRLQTYGTNKIWQDMRLDFYAGTNREELETLSKTNYADTTVVLTSTSHCVANPGKFFIVPYLPMLDDVALPLYLACFDGHKEVFLLGYNTDMPHGTQNWQNDVLSIFQIYDDVQFTIVGNHYSAPDSWRNCRNVKSMDYRSFISYCDI